jgi:uncharacterized protein with PIN domain
VSPRRRSQREPPAPRFLLDRSLGRYIVANALRDAGLDVRTLADHYGEAAAQRVADEEWISCAAEHDWAVLLKDDRIRRRPGELAALRDGGVRAFCITNANLTGQQMADRYLANKARILRAARRDGPFIYGVYEARIERLYP